MGTWHHLHVHLHVPLARACHVPRAHISAASSMRLPCTAACRMPTGTKSQWSSTSVRSAHAAHVAELRSLVLWSVGLPNQATLWSVRLTKPTRGNRAGRPGPSSPRSWPSLALRFLSLTQKQKKRRKEENEKRGIAALRSCAVRALLCLPFGLQCLFLV